ncbi:unnamed protein product [Peronospora belbahrii]|uniref:Phytanoyl-CoA dioxygenase n=1 Tax=Peronospora belbahrii TaxID=622444 RepID=A0AAU9L3Z5_9STRA|nr:unnamed protein product [Peronospora belbahrii]
MGDSDTAQVDSCCYLRARFKSKDVDNQQVFASLLFEKLPTIAGQMLAACDKSKTAPNIFFFNEHYVVKPPRSLVKFRWHRDDDEQLTMCVHRESIRAYISAWCALDDVTRENGALQFVSLSVSPRSNEDNNDNMQRHASGPVTGEAGDVIFFLSNVWHCSSSNDSDGFRRAFYAQYSREKITSRRKDPTPLSFAIPCKLASFPWVIDESAENCVESRAKKAKHATR